MFSSGLGADLSAVVKALKALKAFIERDIPSSSSSPNPASHEPSQTIKLFVLALRVTIRRMANFSCHGQKQKQ